MPTGKKAEARAKVAAAAKRVKKKAEAEVKKEAKVKAVAEAKPEKKDPFGGVAVAFAQGGGKSVTVTFTIDGCPSMKPDNPSINALRTYLVNKIDALQEKNLFAILKERSKLK